MMDTQQVDTSQGSQETVTETQEVQAGTTEGQPEAQQYVPFSTGKEKFKINGQEEEWDWDTTKRYAQLGKAGYSNLETAAKMRKEAERVQQSAKQVYSQLIEYAKRDPEGLIRVLNPKYQGAQSSSPRLEDDGTEQPQGFDPREQKIAELEERLQKWESAQEAQADAEEKKAMEAEFAEAKTKFPRFNHPASYAYLRDQYRKAIINGLDLSIDDVAYMVDDKLAKFEAGSTQSKVQRYEKNRERSPVSSVSAGLGKKGEMTLDDVKRLAGRL